MHMAEAPEEVTVMRRRSNDGARVPVSCPLCLVDYQEYDRVLMKWWKRGSSHILEVRLFNSYVLDQYGKEGDLKRDYE